MPLDLSDRIIVRITADAETPQEILVYDGIEILLTAADVAAMPASIDTLVYQTIVLPGYKRTVAGQVQWLMRPLPDPNIAMLNALPGPGGWKVPASRQTWSDIGMELLRRGVPGEDLRAGFPALFNAARAEIQP